MQLEVVSVHFCQSMHVHRWRQLDSFHHASLKHAYICNWCRLKKLADFGCVLLDADVDTKTLLRQQGTGPALPHGSCKVLAVVCIRCFMSAPADHSINCSGSASVPCSGQTVCLFFPATELLLHLLAHLHRNSCSYVSANGIDFTPPELLSCSIPEQTITSIASCTSRVLALSCQRCGALLSLTSRQPCKTH